MKFVSRIRIVTIKLVLDTIFYQKITRTDILETILTHNAQRGLLEFNLKTLYHLKVIFSFLDFPAIKYELSIPVILYITTSLTD